jgi:hypothetical protein
MQRRAQAFSERPPYLGFGRAGLLFGMEKLGEQGQIVGYGLLSFFGDLFSGCDRICEAEGGLRS